jgi:proliferating cell nuclear antigen PCNA
MQARLSSTATLRNIFDAVEKLVAEVRLTISQENGLSCSEMDSSHVALVRFHLTPSFFEEWQVPKAQTFGINLSGLMKILKFGKDNHALTLNMEPDADSISIAFIPPNSARELSAKHFTVRLMVIEGEQLTVEPIRYRAEIQLPSSKEFATQLADYRTLSDVVTIRVNRNGIAFAVQSTDCSGIVTLKATTVYIDNKLVLGTEAVQEKGDEKEAADRDPSKAKRARGEDDEDEPMGDDEEQETKKSSLKKAPAKKKAKVDTTAGENVTIIINRLENDEDDKDLSGEEVVFSLTLSYLIRFLRASSICPFVCLGMSVAQPLVVHFPIFNGETECARLPIKDPESDLVSLLALRDGQGGAIGYYLAPKIEEDTAA